MVQGRCGGWFDRIERLDSSRIGIARTPQGYAVEAVVLFAQLGLSPKPDTTYKIDVGILTADSTGGTTVARTYWANPATGIVSDVPGEIMLAPGLWGDARFSR